MNGRTKQTQGFTLFEMLVVIVIMGVIASIGFSMTRQRQASAAADTFISLQAREMAIFGEAAQKFAEANKASWTVGARQEITTAQLVAAGHLPNTFAVRGGTAGASPIGETYRVFAIKDAANVARLVVADFGRAPTDALVRRAGYQVNAVSLQGYKARVADEIVKSTKGFAGYVQSGTMTVRGVAGAFSQVLNTYFGNVAPTMPVAIELVGWPEYVRPGSSGPGPGGAGGSMTCNIASGVTNACRDTGGNRVPCTTQSNVVHYLGPNVPSVTQVQAAVPICPNEFGIISTGVAGIALSYTTETRYFPFRETSEFTSVDSRCYDWLYQVIEGGSFGGWGPVNPANARATKVQGLMINNTTVFEEECSSETARVIYTGSTCAIIKETVPNMGVWRVRQTNPETVSYPGYGSWTLQPLTGTAPTLRTHTFYCQ